MPETNVLNDLTNKETTLDDALSEESENERLKKESQQSANVTPTQPSNLAGDTTGILDSFVTAANQSQQNTGNVSSTQQTVPNSDNGFGIQLSDDEKKAQEDGSTSAAAGYSQPTRSRVSTEEIQNLYNDEVYSNELAKADSDSNTLDDAQSLYYQVLGVTQYEDLRKMCGLSDTESFTDYYKRTKYVPKGYEKTARLLLAEEKQKKLWSEYEAGNMGYADFLYEAYGKDYLKSQGYDFSSSLFWYNRYSQGDYSNPLTDTLLADAIAYGDEQFQATKWFEYANTDSNLESLASSLCTGEKLSADNVRTLFKDTFDTLDDYYNDDQKILTLYKAGYISASTFNPFIDIDDDGKADYYYHVDGKLYAVEGSSGTGNKTCKVYYNDDGSMDRVVVDSYIGNSGLSEGATSFTAGFINTFGGIINLLVIVGCGIGSGFNHDRFQELYGNYKSFQNSNNLTSSNAVSLDNHIWEWDDASRGLSNVAGSICAMIVSSKIVGAINAGANAATKAATTAAEAGEKGLATFYNASSKILTATSTVVSTFNGLRGGMVPVGKTATTWLASHAIAETAIAASSLAMQDAIRTAADLSMQKEQYAMQGKTLSDADIFGRATLTFVTNTAASFLFRETSNNAGILDRLNEAIYGTKQNALIKEISSKISPDIADITFDKLNDSGFMNAILKLSNSTGGQLINGFADILENVLTQSNSAFFSNASYDIGDAASYFKTMGSTVFNPAFIANNLYIFKNDIGFSFHVNPNTGGRIDRTKTYLGTQLISYLGNVGDNVVYFQKVLDTIRLALMKQGKTDGAAAIGALADEFTARANGSQAAKVETTATGEEKVSGSTTSIEDGIKALIWLNDALSEFEIKDWKNLTNESAEKISNDIFGGKLNANEIKLVASIMNDTDLFSDGGKKPVVTTIMKALIANNASKQYLNRARVYKEFYVHRLSQATNITSKMFTLDTADFTREIEAFKKSITETNKDDGAKKKLKGVDRQAIQLTNYINKLAHSYGIKVAVYSNVHNTLVDTVFPKFNTTKVESVNTSDFDDNFKENYTIEALVSDKGQGYKQSELELKLFPKVGEQPTAEEVENAKVLGTDCEGTFIIVPSTKNWNESGTQEMFDKMNKVFDYVVSLGYLKRVNIKTAEGKYINGYAFDNKMALVQHIKYVNDVGKMVRAIYNVGAGRLDYTADDALLDLALVYLQDEQIESQNMPDTLKTKFKSETKKYKDLTDAEKYMLAVDDITEIAKLRAQQRTYDASNKDKIEEIEKKIGEMEVNIVNVSPARTDLRTGLSDKEAEFINNVKMNILLQLSTGKNPVLSAAEFRKIAQQMDLHGKNFVEAVKDMKVGARSIDDKQQKALLDYLDIFAQVSNIRAKIANVKDTSELSETDKNELLAASKKVQSLKNTPDGKQAYEYLKQDYGEKNLDDLTTVTSNIIKSFTKAQRARELGQAISAGKIESLPDSVKNLILSGKSLSDDEIKAVADAIVDAVDFEFVGTRKENRNRYLDSTEGSLVDVIKNNRTETTDALGNAVIKRSAEQQTALWQNIFDRLGVTVQPNSAAADVFKVEITKEIMSMFNRYAKDNGEDPLFYGSDFDSVTDGDSAEDMLDHIIDSNGNGYSAEVFNSKDFVTTLSDKLASSTTEIKHSIATKLANAMKLQQKLRENTIIVDGDSDVITVNLNKLLPKNLSTALDRLTQKYKLTELKDNHDAEKEIDEMLREIGADSYRMNYLIEVYRSNPSGVLRFDKNDTTQYANFVTLMKNIGYTEGEVNGIFANNRSDINGVKYSKYDSLGVELKSNDELKNDIQNKQYVKFIPVDAAEEQVVDMKIGLIDKFGLLLSQDEIDKLDDLSKFVSAYNIKLETDENGHIDVKSNSYRVIKSMFLKLGKSASKNGNIRTYDLSSRYALNLDKETEELMFIYGFVSAMDDYTKETDKGKIHSNAMTMKVSKKVFNEMSKKTSYAKLYDMTYDSKSKTMLVEPKRGVWNVDNVISILKDEGSNASLRDIIILDQAGIAPERLRMLAQHSNAVEVGGDPLASAQNYVEYLYVTVGSTPEAFYNECGRGLDINGIITRFGSTTDEIEKSVCEFMRKQIAENQQANIEYIKSKFGLSDYAVEVLTDKESRDALGDAISNELKAKGFSNFGYDDASGKQICDILDYKAIADASGIDEETVKLIVTKLTSFCRNSIDDDTVGILPDKNPYSELASVLHFTVDGKTVISLEDLAELSYDALKILKDSGMITDEVMSKLQILGRANKKGELIDDQDILPTAYKAYYTGGGEATQVVDTFDSVLKTAGSGRTDTQKLQVKLIINSYKNKLLKSSNRTVKLSNINATFGNGDVTGMFMLSMMNGYVDSSTHGGSIRVTNFDNANEIGQMGLTINLFGETLCSTLGIANKSDAYKIAFDIYRRTSGVDESGYYGKYSVIYQDENGEWHSESFAEGTSRQDDLLSLGISALTSEKRFQNAKNVYIVEADKNAMSTSEIGFAKGLSIFKYDDQARNDLKKTVIGQAIDEFNRNPDRYKTQNIDNDKYAEKISMVLSSRASIVDLKRQYVLSATDDVINAATENLPKQQKEIISKAIRNQVERTFAQSVGSAEEYQIGTDRNSLRQEAINNNFIAIGALRPEDRVTAIRKMNLGLRNTYDVIKYFINETSLPKNIRGTMDNIAVDIKYKYFDYEDKSNGKLNYSNTLKKELGLQGRNDIEFDVDDDLNNMYSKDEAVSKNAREHLKIFISKSSNPTDALRCLFQYRMLTSDQGMNIQASLLSSDKFVEHIFGNQVSQNATGKPMELGVYTADKEGNYSKTGTNKSFSPKDLIGEGRTCVAFDIENFYKITDEKDSPIYSISFVIGKGNDAFDDEKATSGTRKITFYIRYSDYAETSSSDGRRTIEGYEAGSDAEEMNRYFNSQSSGDVIVFTVKNKDDKAGLADVAAQINKILLANGADENSTIIGHNSKMTDIPKIFMEFGADAIKVFTSNKHIDTYLDLLNGSVISSGSMDVSKKNLEEMAKQMGISINAHESISDAEVTMRLAYRLISGMSDVNSAVKEFTEDAYDFIDDVFGASNLGKLVNASTRTFTKEGLKWLLKDEDGTYISDKIRFVLTNGQYDSEQAFMDNYQKYGYSLDSQIMKKLVDRRNVLYAQSAIKNNTARIREITESEAGTNYAYYRTLQDGAAYKNARIFAMIIDPNDLNSDSIIKAGDALDRAYNLYIKKNMLSKSEYTFNDFMLEKEDIMLEYLKNSGSTVNKDNASNANNVITTIKQMTEDGTIRNRIVTFERNHNNALYFTKMHKTFDARYGGLTMSLNKLVQLRDSYRVADFDGLDTDFYDGRSKLEAFARNRSGQTLDSDYIDDLEDLIDDMNKNSYSRSYTMVSGLSYGQTVTVLRYNNFSFAGTSTEQVRSDTVYMSRNKFLSVFRMSPEEARDAYGTDEFYITLERHPKARQTVLATYKVAITNDTEFSMLPDVFYNNHSGDFDGDKVLIRTPDVFTEKHGKELSEFSSKVYSINDSMYDFFKNNNVNSSKTSLAKLTAIEKLSYKRCSGYSALQHIIDDLNSGKLSPDADVVQNLPEDIIMKVTGTGFSEKPITYNGKEIKYYSPFSQSDETDFVLRTMHLDSKTNIETFKIKDSSSGYYQKETTRSKEMQATNEGATAESEHIGTFLAYSQYDVTENTRELITSALESKGEVFVNYVFNRIAEIYGTKGLNVFGNKNPSENGANPKTLYKDLILNYVNDGNYETAAAYLIHALQIADQAYRYSEEGMKVYDAIASEKLDSSAMSAREADRYNAMVELARVKGISKNFEDASKLSYKEMIEVENEIYDNLASRNKPYFRRPGSKDSQIISTIDKMAKSSGGKSVERMSIDQYGNKTKNTVKQTVLFSVKGNMTESTAVLNNRGIYKEKGYFEGNDYFKDVDLKDEKYTSMDKLEISHVKKIDNINPESIDNDVIEHILYRTPSEEIFDLDGRKLISKNDSDIFVIDKNGNEIKASDFNPKKKYDIAMIIVYDDKNPIGAKLSISGSAAGKVTVSHKVQKEDLASNDYRALIKSGADLMMGLSEISVKNGKLTSKSGLKLNKLKYYDENMNELDPKTMSDDDVYYIEAEDVPMTLVEDTKNLKEEIKQSDTDEISELHMFNDPNGYFLLKDSAFRLENGKVVYDPGLTSRLRASRQRYKSTETGGYANSNVMYKTLLAVEMVKACAKLKGKEDIIANRLLSSPQITASNEGYEYLMAIWNEMTPEEQRAFTSSKDKVVQYLISVGSKFHDYYKTDVEFDDSTKIESKSKEREQASSVMSYPFYYSKSNTMSHNYIREGDENEAWYDTSDGFYSQEDFMNGLMEAMGESGRFSSEMIDNMTAYGDLNIRNGKTGIMTTSGFLPQETYTSSKMYGMNPGAGKEDPKTGASIRNTDPAVAVMKTTLGGRAIDDLDRVFDSTKNEELDNEDNAYITSTSRRNTAQGINSSDKDISEKYYNDYFFNRGRNVNTAIIAAAKTDSILERAGMTNADRTNKVEALKENVHLGIDKNTGELKAYVTPTIIDGIDYGNINTINQSSLGYDRYSMSEERRAETEGIVDNASAGTMFANYNDEKAVNERLLNSSLDQLIELARTIKPSEVYREVDPGFEKFTTDYDSSNRYRIIAEREDIIYSTGMFKTDKTRMTTSGMSNTDTKGMLVDDYLKRYNINRSQFGYKLLGSEYTELDSRLDTPLMRSQFSLHLYYEKILDDIEWINEKLAAFDEERGPKARKVDGNVTYTREELIEAKNALVAGIRNGSTEDADTVIAKATELRDTYRKTFANEDELVRTINNRLMQAQIDYAKEIGEPLPDHLWMSYRSNYSDENLSSTMAKRLSEDRGSIISKGKTYLVNKQQTQDIKIQNRIYDGLSTSFDFFRTALDTAEDIGKMWAGVALANGLKKTGAMYNSVIYDEVANVVNGLFDEDDYSSVGKPIFNNTDDVDYQVYKFFAAQCAEMLGDGSFAIVYAEDNPGVTVAQQYVLLFKAIKSKFIDSYAKNGKDCSYSAVKIASSQNEADIDAANAVKAYNIMFDIVGKIEYLRSKFNVDAQPMSEKIVKAAMNAAEKTGNVLTDRFGRILNKDVSSFGAFTKYGAEDKEYIITHSGNGYFGTYEQRLAQDILAGDVYLTDKNIAAKLQPMFYKNDPSMISEMINESKNLSLKLIMADPAKLMSRLLNFTMFDFSSSYSIGGIGLAKTFFGMEARKEVERYISSRGKVLDKDLEEFIRATGVDAFKSGEIAAGENIGDTKPITGPLTAYFNLVSKTLTGQHMLVRFATFKFLKQQFETANASGDTSLRDKYLGNSYFLRDSIDSLEDDKIGDTVVVSKAAKQAALVIANQFGTYNDMPYLSTNMSKLGLVFTTFGAALGRTAKYDLSSIGAVVKDIFTGNADKGTWRYVNQRVSSIATMYLITSLLNWLLLSQTGMTKKKAAKEAFLEGNTYDLFRSILASEPVENTSTQWNPYLAIKKTFVNPITDAFSETEDKFFEKLGNAALNEFNNNVYGHINPVVKIFTDSIPNNIFNPYGNSGTSYGENVKRRMLGFVMGSAAANAFINTLDAQTDYDKYTIKTLAAGAYNAFKEEAGNSASYKSNWKNYYKAQNLISDYASLVNNTSSTDYELGSSDDSIYDSSVSSNLAKELKNAMKVKATPSKLYSIIEKYSKQGATKTELQVALRNVSIMAKISKLPSGTDLSQVLSDAEIDEVKSAIAYEKMLFPILYQTYQELTDTESFDALDTDNNGYYFKSSGLYSYERYSPYGNTYSNYSSKSYKTYSPVNYLYKNTYSSNSSRYLTPYQSLSYNPTNVYNKTRATVNNSYFSNYTNAVDPTSTYNERVDTANTTTTQKDLFGRNSGSYSYSNPLIGI